MNNTIIKTTGISYRYSKDTETLFDINLQVEQGSIYGFLGPNGSGKTTTLSLLLGLLNNQQGEIEIFGKNISEHRIDVLRSAGDDLAPDGNHAFKLHRLCRFERFGLRREHALRNAVVVAEVDEEQVSMIPLSVHPTGETDVLAHVGQAEKVTGVSSVTVCHEFLAVSII